LLTERQKLGTHNVEARRLEFNIVDLRDIKAIIDLMKKNSINEFELERQDFKIRLKRGATVAIPGVAIDDGSVGNAPHPMALPGSHPPPTLAPPAPPPGQEIKSPMIGTFYRSPSPESGPYVEIGTEVHPETVVCIIEAMKVMNEIKAETSGVITEALVDNAKPVEFGQPLFRIRPA
jgi:acetyl-CoA carboxylase biotin carboxyl carrier protein